MIKGRDLKYFALGAIIFTSSLSVWAAVSLPNTFKAGDTIKSSEVNENFSSLKAAIDALQVSSVLGDGSVTLPKLAIGGTKADGKVLKLEAGNLTWGDDLIGAGGSSYSAGTGLNLTGTTFSVNPSAVQTRVSANCAAGSSIREILADGTVTCQTDTSGSSYSAGTGLSLTGTTFSVNTSAVQSRVTATCLAGSSIREILANGTVTCQTDNTGTTFATGLGLNLTGGVLAANFTRSGLAGNGTANTIARSDHDHYGQTWSGTGSVGLQVDNTSTAFGGFGVSASSINGSGIIGTTSSPTLETNGVTGINKSTGSHGVGVAGFHEGSGIGVFGQSVGGQGVFGFSPSGTGVYGESFSGIAAKFMAGNGNICTYEGGPGWNCTSDRNKKEHFKTLDSKAMLEKFMRLPITRWNMKGDKKRTPHVGPMAQDFYALFGLGKNNVTINGADAQGVTMKALQGLYSIVKEKDAKIIGLNSRVLSLEARLAALEKAFKSR